MTDIMNPDAGLDAAPPAGAHPDGEPGVPTDLAARWADAPSEPWPRSRRRCRLAGLVAAVVIAGLLAAVILGWLRIRHYEQMTSLRAGALSAASRDAALIATYSYASFDSYTRQIEAMSTPQFAANFRTDSSSLGSVLAQYKAGSRGSVSGAGVGAVSTTGATVYVFLDEKVTNSKETGTTERARMVVTLVRHGGKWLLANAVVR